MPFPDDNYRFGFSEESINSERVNHKGINRMGCFVPSVKEIREMTPNELSLILDLWLYESPTLLIPSNDQIQEVIEVIQGRNDIDECSQAINLCLQYVRGQRN